MRPRQQMPFQWVMAPRQQQMNYQWGNQHPRTMGPMPMQQQPRSNFRMGMPPQPKKGGGLLAKLLGKRNAAPQGGMFSINPSNMTAPVAKGSFLQSLGDPSYVSGLLSNTQQVLKAAQQITPMVQQYGPLVRNIPAIWKLYRGLKDATNENEEVTDNELENEITIDGEPQEHPVSQKEKINDNEEKTYSPVKNGQSKPRLYI
jgi:hypothetical protein